MNILIAVKSCRAHMDNYFHESILNTWGKDVKNADLKFFIGSDEKRFYGSDHVTMLGVPDEYMSLPRKTKAIVGWSLWNGYDYIFLCDTDTFIIPELLLNCGFERYDYSGRFGSQPSIGTTFKYQDAHQTVEACHPWASGGVGYFLSRKAGELVAKSWPDHWAEDLWVGQVLGPHIQAGKITASDLPIECQSSWHFPRRLYNNESYDPKLGWMEKIYSEHNANR